MKGTACASPPHPATPGALGFHIPSLPLRKRITGSPLGLEARLEDFPPPLCRHLGCGFFPHFLSSFFGKLFSSSPGPRTNESALAAVSAEGSQAFARRPARHQGSLYFSVNGGRGQRQGRPLWERCPSGLASWGFSQLALGNLLQPEPAVAEAPVGVGIQTFSPGLKTGGSPVSPTRPSLPAGPAWWSLSLGFWH